METSDLIPNPPLELIMPRFAVLASHITTGSAVSSDALGMDRILKRWADDVRLYAGSSDLDQPKIDPITEIESFLKDPEDVLIYHHSIGWDAGFELLQSVKCRVVIKYHNVTPAQFFSGTSSWHEQKCLQGRQQLHSIASAGYELYLSDSDFNRQELLAAGADAEKNLVVPPFHNVDRLRATPADIEQLEIYRDDKKVLLSVSRVAPHKGVAELIEAFAIYHHEHNPKSRLLVVGREEDAFSNYSARLRELIKFFVLDGTVVFTGEVSDEVLKSYYLLSSAFVFASHHEGFSVPLVEAMALKVPIVCFNSAAIPETVGSAGIVLNEREPALMAEAVSLVVNDEVTNVTLGMNGWHRYEQNFTDSIIAQDFLQALSRLN